MATSPNRASRVRGFTLLEMIVILAILATLVALILPAIYRPLGKSELRHAATQVRTELAKARLAAIESGVPQQFRYQPEGNRFLVCPKSDDAGAQDFLDATRQADVDMAGGFDSASGAPASDGPSEDEPTEFALPVGIRFLDLQVRAVDDRPADEAEEEVWDQRQRWSRPIVFYPNGRTTNARIRLAGAEGYVVDVIVRGLTGTARVAPVQRRTDPTSERQLPSESPSDPLLEVTP